MAGIDKSSGGIGIRDGSGGMDLKAYGDDSSQAVQDISIIAAVEELL